MQKVILKVYIKNKLFPLFVCEIVNDIENTLAKFNEQLNDRTKDIVTFGSISFARSDFRYYTTKNK